MLTKEPEKKLVFTKMQIENMVRSLAVRISKDYAGKTVVLLGVLNGVFMFYSDLVKALTIPVEVDFMRVASYGSDTKSSGEIVITKDVEVDIKDKDVIIVEDITDSGLTMTWLVRHLSEKGARSIKICVLINKLERREVPLDLDYIGFEVEEGFLVGYGLDYDGQYRYLTEIYHLILA